MYVTRRVGPTITEAIWFVQFCQVTQASRGGERQTWTNRGVTWGARVSPVQKSVTHGKGVDPASGLTAAFQTCKRRDLDTSRT